MGIGSISSGSCENKQKGKRKKKKMTERILPETKLDNKNGLKYCRRVSIVFRLPTSDFRHLSSGFRLPTLFLNSGTSFLSFIHELTPSGKSKKIPTLSR